MNTMKTHATATIDDLLKTPEDGRKYELVDGEILVTPAGMRHSEIGVRISHLLTEIADRTGAGKVYSADVGIILPNGNVRSPDVCFVRQEKLPGGKSPDTFGEVIPDLVDSAEHFKRVAGHRRAAVQRAEFAVFDRVDLADDEHELGIRIRLAIVGTGEQDPVLGVGDHLLQLRLQPLNARCTSIGLRRSDYAIERQNHSDQSTYREHACTAADRRFAAS